MSRTFCVLLLLNASLVFTADEWPDFRGPDGQGHSPAKGLPVTWSETENVVWKVEIPGQGWSSPVISGDEIWMTTAIESTKPDAGTPPSTEDYKSPKPGPGTIVSPKPISLRAVSVDLKNGKITKNIEVFFIERPGNIHSRNSYASPSPVIENGRLYMHFGTYGSGCVSTSEPKVLWRNQETKMDHENGPGSSPVSYKDKILICCDGMDAQYMLALDKNTGKAAWKTQRSVEFPPNTNPQMKKAYATGLVATIGGQDQIITPAAEAVYSYSAETGKELWKLRYKGFSNVARPVYDGKLLFVSAGFMNAELLAFKPEGTGTLSPDKIVWRETVGSSRQSSPAVSGNRIYTFSDSGVVRCSDASTGKEFWKEKIAGDAAASPLIADGKVYFFDPKDGATVYADSETKQQLAKNKLDDGFMASPAVSGKALILRTKKSLYRVEQK